MIEIGNFISKEIYLMFFLAGGMCTRVEFILPNVSDLLTVSDFIDLYFEVLFNTLLIFN